jgi:hypothetical protein
VDDLCIPASENLHRSRLRSATWSGPFSADFVAEVGITTVRDGWSHFLKRSIVTRWMARATYARLY